MVSFSVRLELGLGLGLGLRLGLGLGLGSGLGLGLVLGLGLGSGLVSRFSGFTFCQIESDLFDKNRFCFCLDQYKLRLGLRVR